MGKSRQRKGQRSVPQASAAAATKDVPASRWKGIAKIVGTCIVATGVLGAVSAAVVARYSSKAGCALDNTIRLGLTIEVQAPTPPARGPSSLWALQHGVQTEVGTGIADPVAVSDFLAERGAVRVRETRRNVLIQNDRGETVTIVAITAVVAHRSAPFSGALVSGVDGGGPTEAPVTVGFDLDSPDLSARTIEKGKLSYEPYLVSNGLQLTPGESLRFVFVGRSETHAVDWTVEITYVADCGRNSQMVTQSDGKRFTTTAVNARYGEYYRWTGDNGLVPVPAADLCSSDCRTPV
jgi:hypothetical protein